MSIINRVRNLFKEASPRPAGLVTRGSQRSLAPTNTEFIDRAGLSYGLPLKYDLDALLRTYLTDSTAASAINSLVALTLSPLRVSSEAEEGVDEEVLRFNRKVGLLSTLDLLLSDYYLFGFGAAEIIGDGPTLAESSDIVAIKRIEPRSVRVRVDRWGNLEYLQLPWAIPNGALLNPGLQPITLDPEAIVFVARKAWLDGSPYGIPVLASAEKDIEARQMLATLSFRQARALSFPTPVHSIEPDADDNWTREDYEAEITSARSAWAGLEPGDHVFSVGRWKHESFAPSEKLHQVGEELQYFNNQALNACSAPTVAFNQTASMHVGSEVNRIIINAIRTTQNQLTESLNSKLYQRLADIRNLPEVYVEMEAPILDAEKEIVEAEATRLNNVDRKLRMGIIDDSTAAQELGYDRLADPSRLSAYLDKAEAETDVSQNPLAGDRNATQRNTTQLKGGSN